jgi:tryptophan synthase alpha subunit
MTPQMYVSAARVLISSVSISQRVAVGSSVSLEGSQVAELKTHTKKPICVGFGVSKGEHAAQLEGWGADGAIAGSALVRALGEAASPAEGLIAMEALAQELRDALPSRK